jgi:hypothetical protein
MQFPSLEENQILVKHDNKLSMWWDYQHHLPWTQECSQMLSTLKKHIILQNKIGIYFKSSNPSFIHSYNLKLPQHKFLKIQ